MDIYSTEEQQVEAIKSWWRENGKAVVLGAILGIGGLYGWRYFQAEQQTRSEQASEAYITVLETIDTDKKNPQSDIQGFIQNNPGAYAEIVQLQLAKSFVDAGDLTKASEQLRAVQMSKDTILSTMATFRLARIEAEQGHPDKALAQLDKITAESWKAQREALRGDIEFQKGNRAAAQAAYLASIALAPNPVIQMKLDNVSQ